MQFNRKIKSLIDTPKECLQFIHDQLKPKQTEKKQFGEVFTPPSLVEEMLDKLPIEVWSNPKLKWFDPACGMGNFLIAVYLRLMDGLKVCIPDESERKKHILERQLYMSEINPKNVQVYKFYLKACIRIRSSSVNTILL
ncbi:MAG: N-6 DNA methylase [bacterium]